MDVRSCVIGGACAVLAFAASGCSTELVKSNHIPAGKSGGEVGGVGVSYYLPKKLITLSFERKLEDAAVVKGLVDAKAKKQAADSATSAATLALARAKAVLASHSDQDTPAKQEAKKRVEAATAELKVAKAAAEKAATAVKSAEDAVRQYGESGERRFVDSFAVTVHPAVADPTAGYRAVMPSAPMNDVAFEIHTNAAGLLSSANGTSTDQTQAILLSAVDLYAQSRLVAKSASFHVPADGDPAKVPQPFRFKKTFDPTDSKQWDLVTKQFAASQAPYEFGWESLHGSNSGQSDLPSCAGETTVDAEKRNSSRETTDEVKGLYYRRALPYLLTIRKGDVPVESFYLQLPNEAPTELLELKNPAAVTTLHRAAFVDGMLTEYQTSRPSTAAAIVRIPVEFLKSLVSVPAQLFQFRFDNTKAQTDLISQQTELITALNELAAAQRAAAAGPGSDAADDDQP